MKKFIKKILGILLLFIICISLTSDTIKYSLEEENDDFVVAATAAKDMIERIQKGCELKEYPYSDTINIYTTNKEAIKVKEIVENYEEEIIILSKITYREARGSSDMHIAAVAWIILNRVDHKGYGDNIYDVITAPNQFAWEVDTPIVEKHYEICKDVITRWVFEKRGYENVGRIIPNDYLFFTGDGEYNYFRKNFDSIEFWNWSLLNVYE